MEIDICTKLSALVQIAKLRLEKILNKIPGSKDITIKAELIRPLERICGVKWLRLQNVDKIYKFEDNAPLITKNQHVYLIPADLVLFKKVLDQIQQSINKNNSVTYHVIVTPRCLFSFETLLEEMGLYDSVVLYSYNWELIQIDKSVLSLEIPYFFQKTFVNNDFSFLPCFAQSLHTLFCVTGQPEINIVVGSHSKNILTQLNIIQENFQANYKQNSDFEVCLIVDRSIDYLSALLTPTTYSALLKETFTVKCGVVENFEPNLNETKKFLFPLDSFNDNVYSDIKNRHISEVSEIIGNHGRQLKSDSEACKEMALNEIKTYVQTKLRTVTEKKSLFLHHLYACEKIIEKFGNKFDRLKKIEQNLIENISRNTNIKTIEDMILMDDENVSLKLICLMSLTQKLTLDEYNSLKIQFLHKIGYKYLYIFDNLITSGLIVEPIKTKLPSLTLNLSLGAKKDFYSLSNKLKLIPTSQQLNVRCPNCPSYIFNGLYIPIIVQIISLLTKSRSENDFKSKLDLLNGVLHIVGTSKKFPLQRRKILVCIVGGLTYSELAAFELLEKLCSCQIVVVCDCIISSNDLIDAMK